MKAIEDNLKSLEVSEKKTEGEVAALNKRIQLWEEDFERSEKCLANTLEKLVKASHATDEFEHIRKEFDNKNKIKDD